MPDKTKSGIESPAGYNGKTPGNLKAPTKVYPGSHSLGKGSGKIIEGPRSDGKSK